MKSLFEKDLMLNTLGSNIGQSFGKLVDDWIYDNDKFSDINPIELEWVINNEIQLRIHELYLDAVTRIKH